MIFTISILIKSTIILLLTTSAVLALKKSSASLRHLVISLGLFGLILLPVFQYFTPAIEVEIPVVEQLEFEIIPFVWDETLSETTPIENTEKESPEFIQQDVHIPNTEIDLSALDPQQGITLFQLDMDWKSVLFWIWISGFILFLMRIVVQMIRIWIINRSSEAISFSLNELDIKLKRRVIFSTSADIKTPMTFGLFQAKILLPTDAQNWSTEQLKIVLLHELAHIKRCDYLLHLMGLLTLSLFWFHPLVWLLQKWQQSEREKACDEYVLKQGISKTNYAESLVNIARNMLNKKTHRWHSSLPMAANSETKKRVLAILKFDLQQWRFTRWMQWRWIGFFACMLPLLAAIHPATKQMIEDNIPKIEAVLEQPVFVPRADDEAKIITESKVQNYHSRKDRVGTKLVDTIARLPVAAIQQISTKTYLPEMISNTQDTVILNDHNGWNSGNYINDSKQLKDNSTNGFFDKKKEEGLYGKLEEQGKIIEIWTRGAFDVQNSFPYFTNLSSETRIIIQKREKNGKKHEVIFVQKLPFNGKLEKKGYRDGIPVRAGENVYTYTEGNVKKVRYTITTSPYGGIKFSDKKKVYREIQEDWKDIGIADLVERIQADTSFLQEATDRNIYDNEKNQERKTQSNTATLGLSQISPVTTREWQKVIQEYEIEQTLGKQKNKDQANLIQLPSSYLYIPSGQLKFVESGAEEKIIEGFHMSETEITNQQYREFLRAMERRGKTEVLEKARIHNENWISKNGYNEPFARTYHLHPAFNKYPVVNISYEGAQTYCQWMTELYNEVNKNSGWQVEFRLPTKEEWMYAASAGHELSPYPWGGFYVRNAKGCYLGNFKQIDESRLIFDAETNTFAMADSTVTMTSPINRKYKYVEGQGLVIADGYFPNDYGLYNMSGNAAEMLQEKGSTKGGSWNSTGYHVRIDAEDEYADWEEPSPYIGFRPVVVVKKK